MKITATNIRVNDITLHAYHGVTPEERAVGTEFRVTVDLTLDATAAMKYDDLNATVNYAQVVQIVRDTMLQPSKLIEHAAWRIINNLAAAFPTLTGGTVTVTKTHPPISTPTAGASFTATFTK